ncbi:MAG: zinc ribbon domain-containing protein, partial [Chloroflexi bacterium]
MNCPNCGASITAGARFCTNCGFRLSAPAQSTTPPFVQLSGAASSMADVYDNRPGERLDLPEPPVVGSGVGASGLRF